VAYFNVPSRNLVFVAEKETERLACTLPVTTSFLNICINTVSVAVLFTPCITVAPVSHTSYCMSHGLLICLRMTHHDVSGTEEPYLPSIFRSRYRQLYPVQRSVENTYLEQN
jgi:hypothetical protein